MMEGGSTTLAAVPSESSAMAAGLLAAAVVGGLLCMVAGKLFCHRSYPETPSESDSAAAGVLRPPEPLLEVLATSAVAGKVAGKGFICGFCHFGFREDFDAAWLL
ncbi:uncharacterized protein DS421_19g653610 [Arachis hypogaea]|uniref:Uncharacterized protein n=1 Tax=Arachis hypogaea TaxID=3818 RepID=A0A6B9VBF1_ARAHY|nr:uncharacterized protein DS421_19g653610 [Arachis hypogaea]